MENSSKTEINETESQDKWPIVSLRLSKKYLDEILNLTGETSYGKGVKAAVLEYLRFKIGNLPPLNEGESKGRTQRISLENLAEQRPTQASDNTKIAEALTALAASIQTLKTQPQAPAPQTVTPTPAQEAMFESRKLTEAEFRQYFKSRRATGMRDATEANEDAFWQYLLATDFTRSDGTPVTRRNMGITFQAWARIENKTAREEKAKAEAEAAAKKEADEKAEADRKAYEDWNNRMLNWDGDDDL